jgi:hypothetical protein
MVTNTVKFLTPVNLHLQIKDFTKGMAVTLGCFDGKSHL